MAHLLHQVTTPIDNWYNIVCTYNNTTYVKQLYINGVAQTGVTQQTQSAYAGSGVFRLGANYSSGGNYGNGLYAGFTVNNSVLSAAQILQDYNDLKARYNLVTSGLIMQLDANNSTSYPGTGTTVYDLTGAYNHTLTTATFTTLSGVKCFDENSGFVRVNGTGPTLPTSGYTYVTWARIKTSSASWRTLFRTAPDDHPILVEVGTDNLGFYDNNTSSFKDSGYDVTPIEDVWVQYSVVGDNSSSIFYINGAQVGTSVAFGAGGNRHDYWGLSGQEFGYLANLYLYNRKLSVTEITQNYTSLVGRFV